MVELSLEEIKIAQKSHNSSNSKIKAKPITEIEKEEINRFSSGSRELDLVLGGGVVEGSLILIGGSPGIGKSTLLLKVAGNIAKQKKNVLYVSGEESTGQIKLRANRLKANYDNLYLLPEINLENIIEEINKNSYSLIVIDSIQTLYSK